MPPRVLCLLVDGFEEIETLAPVDLLRRAGADVVMASMGDGIHVTGRSGVTIHGDAKLDDLGDQSFDMLVIPGGPGVQALRDDGRAASIAKSFAKANKPVGAICAAPLVLHDAGLLAGKRFTAHDSTYKEITGALKDKRWADYRPRCWGSGGVWTPSGEAALR